MNPGNSVIGFRPRSVGGRAQTETVTIEVVI
jgi:hypothetical protein